MKKISVLLSVLLFTGAILSACAPANGTEIPPVEEEYTYGERATVESIDVIFLESFPLQARAIVSGYFPNGCVELNEITVEHDGQDFILTIQTRQPAGDIACTEALVPFEESVSLDIYGLDAGTYNVIAQDQSTTFTLDIDNAIPDD
jgi:inhibitor of cysteine peptidase